MLIFFTVFLKYKVRIESYTNYVLWLCHVFVWVSEVRPKGTEMYPCPIVLFLPCYIISGLTFSLEFVDHVQCVHFSSHKSLSLVY